LIGRSVADVARDRRSDGVETFLDLGLEDDLGIEFTMALFNANEDRIPELISYARTMVGLIDGGAHVECGLYQRRVPSRRCRRIARICSAPGCASGKR